MQDQSVVADGKLHHDSEPKVLALPLVVGAGPSRALSRTSESGTG